jgi:Arc/MetJ family transcription regulator
MQKIDPKLIAQALEVSDHHDQREVIEAALREYIRNHQQQQEVQGLIDLFGTIEYDEDFDYKAQRQHE